MRSIIDIPRTELNGHQTVNMVHRLRVIAQGLNLPLAGLSFLMDNLRDVFPNLPKDPRTIMRTPRSCHIRHISGGTYVHVGLKSGLLGVIRQHFLNAKEVSIQLNVDGMQVYANSTIQLWTILCRVVRPSVTTPFVVGIYCGNTKPTCPSEYLLDLTTELKSLLNEGIQETNTGVHVTSFICDSPARAFIKQIKGHCAYFGCEFCVQRGVHTGIRMTFPCLQAPRRTDQSFRTQQQPGHHVGQSPFVDLPLSMIDVFPPDYMHAVCLGFVRRFLHLLRSVPRIHTAHVNRERWECLHKTMESIRSWIPDDFQRKCRGVADLGRWKANECRQFLFYIGPVVLLSLKMRQP